MAKTEWRNVLRAGEQIMQEFLVGYAPMCCVFCGDIIGGEFKDLEHHYSQKHQGVPLQKFPCQYCQSPKKTATKRNQHERRCNNKPKDQLDLFPPAQT